MGTARKLPLITVLVLAGQILAQEVTTRDAVTSSVVVRARPSATSARIGTLRPGEHAHRAGEQGDWYLVTLQDGRTGYVSKRWTVLETNRFTIHFVDVGTGDAIIIRKGTTEIVIDGGESASTLAQYTRARHLITSPIELLVITHPDTDHWRGLPALLGYPAYEVRVKEFWDPGYDRSCAPQPAYEEFVQWLHGMPGVRYCRPLAACYPIGRRVMVDDIALTILHTDAHPTVTPCAYTINSSSIVLLVEIGGVRILLTGDATGKLRTDRADVTPKYVEATLLALARRDHRLLRADILKVPHHGSETSSTNDFIAAVNPQYVIICASTRHHLPQRTVVARYDDGARVILRTDVDRRSKNDHIICAKTDETDLECNYEDVFDEQ